MIYTVEKAVVNLVFYVSYNCLTKETGDTYARCAFKTEAFIGQLVKSMVGALVCIIL